MGLADAMAQFADETDRATTAMRNHAAAHPDAHDKVEADAFRRGLRPETLKELRDLLK